MRTRLVSSAMAALVMGGEAMADNSVRYSYAQGNAILAQLSAHGSAMNGSGLGLEGGASIGPHLFAFGSYSVNKYSAKMYDENDNHLKIKLTPATLGVGGHVPLFSSFDLVLGASFERVKLKRSLTGQTLENRAHEGWGGTLGLRGWFSDVIQWDVLLKYSDVGDIKTVLGYTFGGRYYFKSNYSFGVDVSSRRYDDQTLDFNESVVAIVFRHDFGVRY